MSIPSESSLLQNEVQILNRGRVKVKRLFYQEKICFVLQEFHNNLHLQSFHVPL